MAQRVRAKDTRQLGLQSEISSFGGLLGGDHYFVMPYLQRPYEWGEAEVADMIGDLLSASNANYINYFLGHIVGVRNNRGQIEIVDGQQRFITTTIFYAYLRDRLMSHEPALAEELQGCVMRAGRARVTPRPTDATFLRDWIQTPGKIGPLIAEYGKDEEAPYQVQSDAQALMVQAACAIDQKLRRLAFAALADLAIFVLDRAVVDFIIADTRSLAAILYRGMNMRGKQLSPADLIKLEAIEGTGLSDAVKEEAARIWETVEDDLRRENFAFLLEILPLLLSRETTARPGDLTEWSKHAFKHVDPETVLLKLLPVYGEVFQEIRSGEIRAECKDRADEQALANVNRLLKGLLFLQQEKHWIAPAISAVHAHRSRLPFLSEFFKGLDRLTFACFLDGVRHESRTERFAAVVRAGADETQLEHAFALKGGEVAAMRKRLSDPFKRDTWRRRAIAARCNAAFPQGYSFGPAEDVSLEHVLPKNQSAVWQKLGWTPGLTNTCAHLIGNFLLLTTPQNSRAGQRSYEDKLRIYFDWPGGAPVHPLTEDIRRVPEWTERQVRDRTERLIALLMADWDLD